MRTHSRFLARLRLATARPTPALVAVALLLAACEAAPAPDAEPPSSPAAASTAPDLTAELDDAVLGLRVRAQLLEHLGLGSLGLGLAVEDGEVLLSGKVADPSHRPLAAEVARSVDGVRTVDNQIEVDGEPTSSGPLADAADTAERELADAVVLTRVKLALARALRADALSIDVDVHSGVVSLRGEVRDRQSRALAVATAKTVQGADEVHDLLDVSTADGGPS